MPKVAAGEHTRADHVKMLQDPFRWSYWPVIPLKRPKVRDEIGFPQIGIYMDPTVSKQGHKVFEMNLLEIDNKKTWSENFAQAKQKFEYASLDELLDDGWEVD
jgi:hypothetical protein